MRNLWYGVAVFILSLVVVALVSAQVPPGQAPPGQSEYVPIDQLPPQDQLPAAPLLVTAYSFVVLALFAYLWSLARRLHRVQVEINQLERRLPKAKA